MTYAIFLDDERFPPRDGRNWLICRTYDEFLTAVYAYGIPNYISFDHDLGENEKTGHDVAKWIVEACLEGNFMMPLDFEFYVHSQNPVGRDNIQGLLDNYLKFREVQ